MPQRSGCECDRATIRVHGPAYGGERFEREASQIPVGRVPDRGPGGEVVYAADGLPGSGRHTE